MLFFGFCASVEWPYGWGLPAKSHVLGPLYAFLSLCGGFLGFQFSTGSPQRKQDFLFAKAPKNIKKHVFSALSAEYHKIEWHYGWGLPFKKHHVGPKSHPKPFFHFFGFFTRRCENSGPQEKSNITGDV